MVSVKARRRLRVRFRVRIRVRGNVIGDRVGVMASASVPIQWIGAELCTQFVGLLLFVGLKLRVVFSVPSAS